MSADSKRGSDGDFLARFEKLSDEVPADEQEAQEILKLAGIDIAAAFKRTAGHIAAVDARLKRERFAQAEAARSAATKRFEVSHSRRTPAQLRARLVELKSAAGAQAMFRGLDAVKDEDLESLVAHLEELIARGEEEK